MHASVLITFLAATLLVTGCANVRHGPTFDPRDAKAKAFQEFSTTNTINPAWLQPSTNEFRLGPGDHVDIDMIGGGQGPQPALVGPDGKVYFDLLPGISVWGLTLTQTRDALQAQLSHFYKNPRVSVSLREVRSSRVWILGRLNAPGIYALETPMTILDAVTRAGGLYTAQFTGTTEELADLQHSFLLRHGKYIPVDFRKLIHDGDLSQNVYLEADDFLYLPSALATEIYVLGAVGEPRTVSFKDQVTLSSAIANARGTTPDAWLGEVVIIRGSLTDPHYAVVNFRDILKGKAPEVALQPHDIVYVPDHPLGMLQNALHTILTTFVSTVAANEGIRAAGGGSNVGVGVNVGP